MGAGQPEVLKSVAHPCLPVSLHMIINLDAFFSRGIIKWTPDTNEFCVHLKLYDNSCVCVAKTDIVEVVQQTYPLHVGGNRYDAFHFKRFVVLFRDDSSS